MELLAPAGDYRTAVAAVNAGADSVYLGGTAFHARKSSAGLTDEDLCRAADYLHGQGKKLYVTVNTLIGDEELAAALDYVQQLRRLPVDALIIQDVGLLRLIHSLWPEQELHASTQMSIMNQWGLDFLAEQGVKRVVLARELSREDLLALAATNSPGAQVEKEIFVHGALCYAYSGLCRFSSLVGGRSANRGQCAQPCRWAYSWLRPDGTTISVSHGQHLLSTMDLALLTQLSALQTCGIHALKIEGRMKRYEYAAAVTRRYRTALEELAAGNFNPNEAEDQLQRVFNRGLSSAYFKNTPLVLSPSRPDNRGQLAGKIVSVGRGRAEVELCQPLALQDGVVARDASGRDLAQTTVRVLYRAGQKISSAAPGELVSLPLDLNGLRPETHLYKTSDYALQNELQALLPEKTVPEQALEMTATLKAGDPVRLSVRDRQGHVVTVESATPVEIAARQPLTAEVVREKLTRLGGSGYYAARCELDLEPDIIFPFRELKQLRRDALDALLAVLPATPPATEYSGEAISARLAQFGLPAVPRLNAKPLTKLAVMTATLAAAAAAFSAGADWVYLDMSFVEEKAARSAQDDYVAAGKTLVLAGSPVLHPVELRHLADTTLRGDYMLSNWGDLARPCLPETRRWVNFTLNVYNAATLAFLQKLPGLQSVCLSPELSWPELRPLCAAAVSAEIIVHGSLPLMISRACLWRNHRGCSGDKAVCPAEATALRDRKGFIFPLQNDLYCRQHLYNSRTQCLLGDLPAILEAHPAALRIEGRLDAPDNLSCIVAVYRTALDAYTSHTPPNPQTLAAWKEELAAASPSALTHGRFHSG